ncbi:Transposase (plasmid) [Planktothrix agardhii]|jgi:hypothetical protein|uniref:Transposase n=1 Tax=Planktothrix agardhii TaxID=1160 RepID=A0A1J1JL45_PLAAG|nr:Transposase [Planktothrix agardhii]CUM62296.1 transposase [Planktothrix agardhii]
MREIFVFFFIRWVLLTISDLSFFYHKSLHSLYCLVFSLVCRPVSFISLVLLIAIAYSSATIQGQQIKRKGIQKYIARIKEYGRIERRHSSFYIGLYGQTWVNFKDVCMDLVTKLMKLNRNKCKYYQQGLRAMRLIESVL